MATAASEKRDAMREAIPSYKHARSKTTRTGAPERDAVFDSRLSSTGSQYRDPVTGRIAKAPTFLKFVAPIKNHLSSIESSINRLSKDHKQLTTLYPKYFASNEKAISTIVRETELTNKLLLDQQNEFQRAVLAKLTGTETASRAAGAKGRSGRRPSTGASRASRGRELTRTARAVESGIRAPKQESVLGDKSTKFRFGDRRQEVLDRAKNIESIKIQKTFSAMKIGAAIGAVGVVGGAVGLGALSKYFGGGTTPSGAPPAAPPAAPAPFGNTPAPSAAPPSTPTPSGSAPPAGASVRTPISQPQTRTAGGSSIPAARNTGTSVRTAGGSTISAARNTRAASTYTPASPQRTVQTQSQGNIPFAGSGAAPAAGRNLGETPAGSPQRVPQPTTKLTGSKAEREQALINAAKQAGITDKTELAQFMAQWAHESGNFRYMQEIWGPTAAQRRYEGRRDLGNVQQGDGYRYRGRGFSQLTGRANYRTIGSSIGVDLENNPDLASQPDIAAKIAIEYWKSRVKPRVDNFEDTRRVTRLVNGGYNGLEDRIAKFAAYKQKDFSVGTPVASVPATDARGNIQSAARNEQTQTGAAGPSAGAPPAGAATAVAFARSVLGLHERTNNQQLVDYMKAGGVSINPARTAWCAAFVNASLARAGIQGTGSLAAGSFANWGTAVTKPEEVQAGDVIVNRKRSPRTGLVGSHVALATGPAQNISGTWYIPAIDGNWADAVSEHNGDSGYNFSTHNVRRAGASSLIAGFTPQAVPNAPGTPTPSPTSLTKEANVPATDQQGTTGTGETGRSSGYTTPVDGARISSKFGYRIHPIRKTRRMHTGVDYAAASGTPVKSTADGTVIRAGRAGGYGNLIEVQHSDGTTSRYAHLSSIDTRVGAPVKQGQIIGKVGSTGMSTGPHLHFEIRKNNSPIDPQSVLSGSATTVAAAEGAKATEPIAGPGNTLAVPGPGGQMPAFSAPTMQMNPFVGSPLFGLAQMVSMMGGGSGFAIQPMIMRQTNIINRRIPVNSAPFVSAPIALQGAASIFANIARMI